MITNENKLNDFILNLKHKYKNRIQDIQITQCTDSLGTYLKLVLIKIKRSQRNVGYGSTILGELCSFADTINVRIFIKGLYANGHTLKRLYDFYSKQGFVLIKKGFEGEMIYYPT
jgi:hypothetical protein